MFVSKHRRWEVSVVQEVGKVRGARYEGGGAEEARRSPSGTYLASKAATLRAADSDSDARMTALLPESGCAHARIKQAHKYVERHKKAHQQTAAAHLRK